jgi:hypothetical protein
MLMTLNIILSADADIGRGSRMRINTFRMRILLCSSAQGSRYCPCDPQWRAVSVCCWLNRHMLSETFPLNVPNKHGISVQPDVFMTQVYILRSRVWLKLHNEELHKLYSSPDIYRMSQKDVYIMLIFRIVMCVHLFGIFCMGERSRGYNVRGTGHAWNRVSAYKIVVWKPYE